MSGRPTALLAAAALAACQGGGASDHKPPPDGLPWVGAEFELKAAVAALDCPGSAVPWAPQFTRLLVDQQGSKVAVTLESLSDPDVRPVSLRGCVVGDADAGFALRLTGSVRSVVAQGEASCEVRLTLPAALGDLIDAAEAEAARAGGASTLGTREDAWMAAGCPVDGATAFPAFELGLCSDGALRGAMDVQLAWAGAACHAGAPCELALDVDTTVTRPHPDAPPGALVGGVCAH